MLHLRVIAPEDRADRARAVLLGHRGVTNVVVLPGAGLEPRGDVLLADVARESASAVLQELRRLELDEHGSIAVENVDVSLSRSADRAKALAPGEGDDAVVWEDLQARTAEDSTLSGSYLLLFGLATVLAGIAVLLDSAILVIGAMIVGPEFGALAAVCAGVVLRDRALVRRAAVALSAGFAMGVGATVAATWTLTALGLVDPAVLFRPRPQTGFIYLPDTLSLVVALLAGVAGMQALTSAKSGAVLGVLVSVTTIPAAGNLAVAAAYGLSLDPDESRSRYFHQALTSTEQLVLNLLGIVVAGTLTLAVQRRLQRRAEDRSPPEPSAT